MAEPPASTHSGSDSAGDGEHIQNTPEKFKVSSGKNSENRKKQKWTLPILVRSVICVVVVGGLYRFARGIVQDVDPLTENGNRKLEEGNFKVYVNVVHDTNVQLPCPHDEYFTTLGHIGQGSVIWPRELLVFNANASTCS
ncbi:hypothetical protein FRX31_026867 [Thalictrum thalictroides]|uniref:DUF8039 domain-containing protein n=1 Tax=Thalictrum thalictroides TaxID=46969 RepID=A0A7J6VEM2_THATH|nr:hypothetical protein FRX31_026867 [Thalictrum thalictroides]